MASDIDKIEKRLWSAADNLRANSNFASNEYFLPVMGLIFLRHAYSRYLSGQRRDRSQPCPAAVARCASSPKRTSRRKGAIFLRPKAQFDYLVGLPDGDDRAKAIIDAMDTHRRRLRVTAKAHCPRANIRNSTMMCSGDFSASSTTRR